MALEDREGQNLTPRHRKARALLAYLALTGRPCPRSKIADLLWSDRGQEQARSSVRQAIFDLRHVTILDRPVVATFRDEVELDATLVETDLAAILRSAGSRDFAGLTGLLRHAGAGLLSDLDGLDPEYDDWLRIERAREPARTLEAAVAAAGQAFDLGDTDAAEAIVTEVQRLDPTGEEAARVAMRIAHSKGDKAALHRHFALLDDRLKAEVGAGPSDRTIALFRELEAEGPLPEGSKPLPAASRESRAAGREGRWNFAAAGAVPAAVLVSYGLLLRPAPAVPAQLPLLAVLPFDQQQGTSEALAEGLWDDTRLALSQGRAVRVLGRTTTLAVDSGHRSPQLLRKQFDVDYVLGGGVRTQGQRVRIIVSLTRASDGISLWEQSFDGRLGDPMSLQLAVASAIEGSIRGRLAPGGGRRAEQIATSPEVYELYSQARILIRTRQMQGGNQAVALLRRAVALDPNYAPAWASLGSALYFARYSPQSRPNWRSEARGDVRRAIDLAPNLAKAHAISALVEGLKSPSAQRSIERAVALDPGDAEAWLWLGNNRCQLLDIAGCSNAYRKAIEIDPYLAPAVDNLVQNLINLGDEKSLARLIRQLDRAGAGDTLVPAVRAAIAYSRGDYSAGLGPLLRIGAGEKPPTQVRWRVTEGLIRLGLGEEAARFAGGPSWLVPVMRSERVPPVPFDSSPEIARAFWQDQDNVTCYTRAILNLGGAARLVRSYRLGFASANDLIMVTSQSTDPGLVLPNLVAALQAEGDASDAAILMAGAEENIRSRIGVLPRDGDPLWQLAQLRALQGHPAQAEGLLLRARSLGFLPDGWQKPLDIAQEPAFRTLRDRPRFQELRREILAHIERERRELGPVRL